MDLLRLIDFGSPVADVKKLDGYGSLNYRVSLTDERVLLVKIYPAVEKERILEEERIIGQLQQCLAISLNTPVDFILLPGMPEEFFIRVCRFIEGETLSRQTATDETLVQIAEATARMVLGLQSIKSHLIKAHEHDWNLRDALRNKPHIDFISNESDKKIVTHFLSVFERETLPAFAELRQGIIHGDLNEANILVRENKIQGFIDFGDISYAPLACEPAILLTYILMMFPEEGFSKAALMIKHFQAIFPLSEKELEVLPQLIAARLCVSVCKSAQAKAGKTDTDYILISEKPAWNLLHKWVATNPVFIKNVFLEAAGFSVEKKKDASILSARKKVSAASLSLSYAKPVYVHSALFQYMYDAHGGTYLDAYNNIPHVGHSHPAIADAACRQIRKLNTNTRYLFDAYVEYSEKLLSLFPEKMDKVLLVNSGSEASDLACRIARTVTGRSGIAVLEWGYHGNTLNGIHISSYKFDRKGGKGPEEHILRLPLPNGYRGKHDTAEGYFREATQLIEAFEKEGKTLAAFIAEPVSGCGGQVPLIDGYLKLLVPYLKEKGIIVIIDEVQTGFGRLGDWFWGFDMHGIEPDMVVLGKPMGNGHPIGAVVTTGFMTDAFNNGMEFFSSFGGNPVSCEIGKAVIETIQQEGLQQNAKEVGRYWMQQLNEVKKDFSVLGDVRGAGLFIGVECIREDGTENTALAQQLANGLKENYILTSTDGPLDNVLKMKPPLCFSKENADRHIEVLFKLLQATK